jgi:hypothetical protein
VHILPHSNPARASRHRTGSLRDGATPLEVRLKGRPADELLDLRGERFILREDLLDLVPEGRESVRVLGGAGHILGGLGSGGLLFDPASELAPERRGSFPGTCAQV